MTNRELLARAGFLPFEIRQFTRTTRTTPKGKHIRVSRMSLDTPYIQEMIQERAETYTKALELKLSRSQWVLTIKEMYEDRYWFNDPWEMLRAWEERYKDKHPEYTSPWIKKKKQRADFGDKFDKGEEKYPRGAHYKGRQ